MLSVYHQDPVATGTNQVGDLPEQRIETLSRQRHQWVDTLSR